MFKRMLVLFALSICSSAFGGDIHYRGVKPSVLIDVRSAEEYAGEHIDGAINIPHEQIASGIVRVKGIDKDSPILLYCRSGRRSGLAAEALKRQGYTQVINGGGIEELKKEIQP